MSLECIKKYYIGIASINLNACASWGKTETDNCRHTQKS